VQIALLLPLLSHCHVTPRFIQLHRPALCALLYHLQTEHAAVLVIGNY